ncbi:hypothetical protein CHU92_13910 [Flavobacterium cyanobacteriorum]|uniref:DUF4350 domain-containing protein n=1 Tax=Flavobacterium cyanobacteriorum TaxID=2022802 RepID=A0A255YV09_9FLAO|nr:DUF4350 domain-containing protein [Flavobacterium cyanobacteriorum]OYQ33011.1 hypothetical protein CHU92_13910 [Flavobacterium cyanobacteriorum]
MNRKLIFYIVLLGMIVGLIIFIDASKPKPINWTPTYLPKDKYPLGLYVLDRELKGLTGNNIKRITVTPYEFLDEQYDHSTSNYKISGTFLHINESANLDKESVKELLYFAEHGNTVLLSMKDFPEELLDTLQVTVNMEFARIDSIPMYITADGAARQKYYFNEGMGFTYFDSINNQYAKTLGYQEVNKQQRANFIKAPFGNGSFLLHTQPAVFSNFHLLKGNHYQYTEKLLSYIKPGTIYWYSEKITGVSSSPLRYIIKQPGLKWALYFGLIGLVIFIFFNAKRKQRIVPEIPPVRNTTVDFTKTIGNLYYQEGNHHTIIDKKIIYFLEKIRNEYLIDTYALDDEFIEKLHLKTGKPIEDIRNLVRIIKVYRHKFDSTEADVIEINKAIENLML